MIAVNVLMYFPNREKNGSGPPPVRGKGKMGKMASPWQRSKENDG